MVTHSPRTSRPSPVSNLAPARSTERSPDWKSADLSNHSMTTTADVPIESPKPVPRRWLPRSRTCVDSSTSAPHDSVWPWGGCRETPPLRRDTPPEVVSRKLARTIRRRVCLNEDTLPDSWASIQRPMSNRAPARCSYFVRGPYSFSPAPPSPNSLSTSRGRCPPARVRRPEWDSRSLRGAVHWE